MSVSSQPVAGPDYLMEFLATNPTAIANLLERHADDGHGKCTTCTAGAQRGYLPWPCTLYNAASQAQRQRRATYL